MTETRKALFPEPSHMSWMKQMFLLLACLATLSLSLPSAASIDVYEFTSEEERQSYLRLIRELRCPKCQNQDIADSNAPIATDMRREVHRLVKEGKSHNDVVDFMIERFGDFVTYKPRFDASTALLWLGPGVVAVIGLLTVVGLARRKNAAQGAEQVTQLDRNDEEKLRNLLNRYGEAGADSKSDTGVQGDSSSSDGKQG